MQYIDTKQAAQILKITPRRVVYLLQQKRIRGAYKIGKAWAIPLYCGKPNVSRGTRGPKPRWTKPRLPGAKIIHVNGQAISKNQKDNGIRPVISVKQSVNNRDRNDYGHEVEIYGYCRLVYRPDKPRSCGATLWIETYAGVDIVTFIGNRNLRIQRQ
ncbi:MAG: helix-turn-helix domain-containing protein [Spirulinaceae cyanobacterium]